MEKIWPSSVTATLASLAEQQQMRHNDLQTIGPHGHEAPSVGQQKSPLDARFQQA